MKVASTVLGGEGRSNSPDLLDAICLFFANAQIADAQKKRQTAATVFR